MTDGIEKINEEHLVESLIKGDEYMDYEKVIRGKIVQDEVFDGEVGINNGKIEKIVSGFNLLKSKSIEIYEESYIFPGFIDVHVHCYSNPNEGFINTSMSAAAGGITTFLDMPYDRPHPINNVDRFIEKVNKLENESVVDIGLWGTITKENGTDQIIPMIEAGASSFKMSTFETDSYRFPRIADNDIIKSMEILKEKGILVAFHAENDELIKSLIHEYVSDNKVYPKAHNEARPPLSETSAVLKLLEFAYWTDAKLHIVHVSHPRTIELINFYKNQGVQVTCETCYTYLHLDIEDLNNYGPMAKINPPLRHKSEVQELWSHLYADNIDLVSSDHSPWGESDKAKGDKNIFLASAGLPGLEVMVPLMFNSTVAKGKMNPAQLAKLMSSHPAEKFRIKNKGFIKEGFDADFTIINPKIKWKIDHNKFRSNSKKSPFHGKEIEGRVIGSFVRGEKIFDGVEVRVNPGFGRFVPGAGYKEKS